MIANTSIHALAVRDRREFWDVPYNGVVDELKVYDAAIALENAAELFAERA